MSAELFGTANNVTFQNNKVTNNAGGSGVDFVTSGQIEVCDLGDGSFSGSVSPIGVPEDSAIVGNSISAGPEAFPIVVNRSDKITVAKNILSGFVFNQFTMIQVLEDSNSQVSNNQINGSFDGILASDFQAAVPGFPPNSSHVHIRSLWSQPYYQNSGSDRHRKETHPQSHRAGCL